MPRIQIDESENKSRNGRFKGAGVIVKSPQATDRYRIYNSGNKAFSVAGETVAPDCSIDLRQSSGDIVTSLITGVGGPIRGVYELLNDQRIARPGRFANQGTTAVTQTMIRVGQVGIYRFFNGKDNGDITITEQNGASPLPTFSIRRKQSMDIAVSINAYTVQLAAPSGANEDRGIYEIVNARVDARPGRFKVANGAAQVISDLSQLVSRRVVYRFFNSGDNDIEITQNGVAVVAVVPKNSIDYSVVAGATASPLRIEVKSVGTTANRIEGIYECLGVF